MGYTRVSVKGTIVECFVEFGDDGITRADLGCRDRWGNAAPCQVWYNVLIGMWDTVQPEYIREEGQVR